MSMFGKSFSKFWKFFILSSYTHMLIFVSMAHLQCIFSEIHFYFHTVKKPEFFLLFMLLSALLLIPQITTFPIWFEAYCTDTKKNYTQPQMQPRDWITSGTLCFSCSVTFSSCTLFELPSDVWYNSEHFQLTLHSRVVKPLGAGRKVPVMYEAARGKARAASLKLILCARVLRRKSLQSTGTYFVGLSIN